MYYHTEVQGDGFDLRSFANILIFIVSFVRINRWIFIFVTGIETFHENTALNKRDKSFAWLGHRIFCQLFDRVHRRGNWNGIVINVAMARFDETIVRSMTKQDKRKLMQQLQQAESKIGVSCFSEVSLVLRY